MFTCLAEAQIVVEDWRQDYNQHRPHSAPGTTSPARFAGRIELINLWPLAQSEIAGARGNFVDALFAASPPRVDGATIGREAFAARVSTGGCGEAFECGCEAAISSPKAITAGQVAAISGSVQPAVVK